MTRSRSNLLVGFVCPAGMGSELASRIRTLADMGQSERNRMGKRAKEFCDRAFDRSALLSKLEDWMAELAQGSAKQESSASGPLSVAEAVPVSALLSGCCVPGAPTSHGGENYFQIRQKAMQFDISLISVRERVGS